MFSLVFRAREGFSRSITILLIVALQIYISTLAYKTDYLFTMKVFDWDESRFTQISTVDLGNICLVPLILAHTNLLVSAPDPGLHAAAASPQLQAQGPRHHHWPGGCPLKDPWPGGHWRLLAPLSRGDFLHPRSASECLMSHSQHVWFSLCGWDDGAPGVHGHLVSAL